MSQLDPKDKNASAQTKNPRSGTSLAASLKRPEPPTPSATPTSPTTLNSAQRPLTRPTFGSTASTPTATTRSTFGSTASTPTAATKPTFGSTASTTAAAKPTFGTSAPKPTFTGFKSSTFAQPSTPSFAQSRPTFGQTTSFSATHSAAAFNKDLKISDEEFKLIRDFIYRQCGIFIAENRKYLVENRLASRIKELHLNSYNEYYKYLKFDVNKDAELNKLFVLVTTNETSFFRNPPQLKVFQENVLTDLIEKLSQSNQRKLRIWSAGCSTGEEPYTLAIILSEVLKNDLLSWDIRITANDLSTQVLQAARLGIYNEYSLRTTPKELVEKYFVKDGQVYKIKDELKRMISFGQINLSNREQLKRVERSHIVFCRNVIIYFDDDMKRKVINAFYDNLLPGGALLIGHSETLHNICRSFELEHRPGCIVYRKQA